MKGYCLKENCEWCQDILEKIIQAACNKIKCEDLKNNFFSTRNKLKIRHGYLNNFWAHAIIKHMKNNIKTIRMDLQRCQKNSSL